MVVAVFEELLDEEEEDAEVMPLLQPVANRDAASALTTVRVRQRDMFAIVHSSMLKEDVVRIDAAMTKRFLLSAER